MVSLMVRTLDEIMCIVLGRSREYSIIKLHFYKIFTPITLFLTPNLC
jgi:hypothetical protein